MHPFIAIRPIHIFTNESGQRIQIAVVVGVVHAPDQLVIGRRIS
jgi:hypothetical protein